MAQIDDLQQAVDALKTQMASVINQQRFPIGTVLPYAGTDVPPGFLLADGRPVDPLRPEFAALAALLGSVYALPGDPVATCRLPNLLGRVVRGAKDAGSVGTLSGSDSFALAFQQLPQHHHGVVGAWHASGSDEGRCIGGGNDIHRVNLPAGGGLGTWWEYSGTFTTMEPPGAQQTISVVQASCDLSFIIKF